MSVRIRSDLRNFNREHKSNAGYLDVAANAHGAEKALLMKHALQRLHHARPHVVEVGPGGGSAVTYLAAQFADDPARGHDVQLTLIEAPGVLSQSLTSAVKEFNKVGTCEVRYGFAQDLGSLLADPVDVISASALLHEVYSYGGGYAGLHAMIRTLPSVLTPGGSSPTAMCMPLRGHHCTSGLSSPTTREPGSRSSGCSHLNTWLRGPTRITTPTTSWWLAKTRRSCRSPT